MRIDARFNGPPTSGHGGVATGLFATAVDRRAATVRLLAPPPLDTDLETVANGDEGHQSILGPDGPIASVRPLDHGRLESWVPSLASEDELDHARAQYLAEFTDGHVFPTCFGCGPARPDGDGLELFAGVIDRLGVTAAGWTPDNSLSDGDGVEPWEVWAAVDCPSGLAALPEVADLSILVGMVLGEMSLRVDGEPRVGERCQVQARHRSNTGRRHLVDVCLIGDDARLLAVGAATWVEIHASPDHAAGT
jgi:hypothetical protein